MQKFIESLTEGSRINILGEEYVTIGCVDYVMYGHPETTYTKVYLNDDRILVLVASDNYSYFGKDIGVLAEGNGFGKNITFEGKNYELQTNDYQVVKCVRYGNPAKLEGEVEFWDYQGIDDPKSLISLAIVAKTGKRSDVIELEVSETNYFIVKTAS
jgi:hypothetical protein